MEKKVKILSVIVFAFFVFSADTYVVNAYSLKCIGYTDIEQHDQCIDFMKECVKNSDEDTCIRRFQHSLSIDDDTTDSGSDCSYVFGDPNDDTSVAYMMQKVFDYAKIIAPLLVVLLSGFDFAKNALSGDQDNMKKATNKLAIRLVCAVLLYFVPMLTSFILNLINNSSVDQTCNIS
ncbi:MAG: hypothetical protein IKO49_08325 [Bacilli bacterium]|nr:hypothetical protein [Bacilli bacterium]